jgi:mannosyltransferase OCH1-like enzyme
MIPKTIHYCWFGQKEIPQKHAEYIAKWSKTFEGYAIVKWNEENSPMHLPYMQTAYKNKKWANLSNFTRLWAIYEQGGIYLDTDIEVLKTFDPLLSNNCFLGFEDIYVDWDGCINNAVIGAEPKHPFILEMKERLLNEFDGLEEAHLSSPNFTTRLLKEKGLREYKEQQVEGVHIYPIQFFYPYSWHQKFTPECVKENTFCIHHFEKSWSEGQPKVSGKKLPGYIEKIKGELRRFIK